MKPLRCQTCAYFRPMRGALPPLNPDVFDSWTVETDNLLSVNVPKSQLRFYAGECNSSSSSHFLKYKKQHYEFADRCKKYIVWYKFFDTVCGGQFKGKDLNAIIETNRKRYKEHNRKIDK